MSLSLGSLDSSGISETRWGAPSPSARSPRRYWYRPDACNLADLAMLSVSTLECIYFDAHIDDGVRARRFLAAFAGLLCGRLLAGG